MLLVPNREEHEVRWEILVVDRVSCVEILSTKSPPIRDLVSDPSMQPPEPIPRRVTRGVDRPRVETIPVHRSLLAVNLDGHDYILALKALGIHHLAVVLGPAGTPRKVIRPGVLYAIREEGENRRDDLLN